MVGRRGKRGLAALAPVVPVFETDDLRGSDRVGIGVVDDADATDGAIATAVDDLSRNVGIVARFPEEPRQWAPRS